MVDERVDSIDLRQELAMLFQDYGSEYLLISNDKKLRCKCVDSLYNSGKDKCPICFGTGYISFARKVIGRETMASIPETLPRMIASSEPGEIAVPAKQFYIQHDVRPRRKDLIVVCQWKGNVPIFDEYTEIFLINEAEPNKADNGRIEYFIASAHADPINASIKLTNIKKNIKEASYYVSVGDYYGFS